MSVAFAQDRRSAARSAVASAEENRIAFRCGAEQPWLLLGAEVAVQVAVAPRLARVPQTQPWFRGVMNLRGNLYPLFDLVAWAGGVPAALDATRILMLDAGEAGAGLVAADLPRLLRVQRTNGILHDAGALSRFVVAEFTGEPGVLFEFDFRRWLTEVGRHVVHVAE